MIEPELSCCAVGRWQAFEPAHSVWSGDYCPLSHLLGDEGAILDGFIDRRAAEVGQVGEFLDGASQLSIRELAIGRVRLCGHVRSIRVRSGKSERWWTELMRLLCKNDGQKPI